MQNFNGLPLSNCNVAAARMNTRLAVSALRPATNRATLRVAASRYYATAGGQGPSSASSKRRAVTPFNDDGHVPWSDLSVAEKGSRAAQQTFNFGFILVGVALTVWPHLLKVPETGGSKCRLVEAYS